MALRAMSIAFGADSRDSVPVFPQNQREFYERQIQPILSENCFKCHSHQAEKIKGSLVLDSRAGALKGGDSGPALVPGDADRSLMIRAVRHLDEDLQMPPKKQLEQKQIALLVEWVKMGAPYAVGEAEVKSQRT